MAKIYLVLGANVEYNDEYHYLTGWGSVASPAYHTKEDAQVAAKAELKRQLSDFTIMDFEDWGGPNINRFLHETDADKWQTTFGEYIDWCDTQGITDWSKDVPALVTIKEVELPEV